MDLDDTIFQTLRKCKDAVPLSLAAISRYGEPLSFMTERQRAFFAFLDAGAIIIPTTARNLDAFNRVSLTFRHCVILNFGGVVLTPERTPDMDWLEKLKMKNQKTHQKLKDAFHALLDFIEVDGLAASARLIGDFGLDFYIVVKNKGREKGLLDHIYRNFFLKHNDEATYIHYNDNNLCMLPRHLNKRYAVEYVIEKYIAPHQKPFLTIGMGDSASDLDFMAVCDYMITPSRSQIRKITIDAALVKSRTSDGFVKRPQARRANSEE